MTNGDGPDKLNIGRNITTLSELIEEGYVYVDKTDFVHRLLTSPDKRIFLSRPRRFGKTLLIDTLEEASVGRKELFSGLAIDRLRKNTEWPRSHVLRIDMSGYGDEPALLDRSLAEHLHSFAAKRGFSITAQDAANSLRQVIEYISKNYDEIPIITRKIRRNNSLVANRNKIIVLIDEYDAPIINHFTAQTELAIATRTLHGFYNALKSCDDMIERVFITGITKFSQLSVFSAMNNLVDITFDSTFSTICGFTKNEIVKYYSQHLDSVLTEFKDTKKFSSAFTRDSLMERILEWYDGYSWNGDDSVINPLSLQNFLVNRFFDNFWIKTGGSNFLNQMNIRDDAFSAVFNGEPEFNGSVEIQDVGNTDPVALMLQTGYLTVRKRYVTDQFSELYLAMPNKEVGMTIMKNYLDTRVIPSISQDDDNFTPERCKEFCDLFCQGKFNNAEDILQSILSSIPYPLHVEKESYYHLFLLTIFKMVGYKAKNEHNIANGTIDLVIKSPHLGYMVTEIKYAKSDIKNDGVNVSDIELVAEIYVKDDKKLNTCIKNAFKQIIEKDYLLPFRGSKIPVHAVAVAVCGRNHVRIRCCLADELLQKKQEFIGNTEPLNTAPVHVP
jgi:hypothetical protein